MARYLDLPRSARIITTEGRSSYSNLTKHQTLVAHKSSSDPIGVAHWLLDWLLLDRETQVPDNPDTGRLRQMLFLFRSAQNF